VPGLHTFRITNAGLQAFSRTLGLAGQVRKIPSTRRLSLGIPELDKMLGGGFPKAIVSWWQGLRGRENRFWQPNS
jgi:circadian clock protein KaiC